MRLAYALLTQLGFVTTLFWLWMIYDCFQIKRDRQKWLRILVLLHILGALLYFTTRWLPRHSIPVPRFLHRWTRRHEVQQAETAAITIGNAHQFVQLGNILYDIGDRRRALTAYLQAIEQEPANSKANWGVACIEFDSKNLQVAKRHLQTLLRTSPNFRYGEASLLYGHVLLRLNELDQANIHLETYLTCWSTPEAYILLATVQQQQGNAFAARCVLETLMKQIQTSTPFQYRNNQPFIRQGRRMLKMLAR